MGTAPYSVALRWSDDGFTGQCTCPHFADGNFCKHLVALGLAVVNAALPNDRSTDREGAASESHSGAPGIDDYLDSLSPAELKKWVITLAAYSPGAAHALEYAANLALGNTASVETELNNEYRRTFRVRGYIGYWEAMDFAHDVDDFLVELERLLRDGYPKIVAPMLVKVTKRLRTLIETRVDDSSGMVGDACQRALNLYAQACIAAPPSGSALGTWLAKFRLDSPGWPDATLAQFSGAFSHESWLAYRRATAKAWDRWCEEKDPYTGFEIRRMMLELADHDEDVDQAVEVLALGPRKDYQGIIERLKRAGRDREAMSYLDQAVDQYRSALTDPTPAHRYAARLGVAEQFAVDLYCEDGREDEALDLARLLLNASPTPSAFDFLLSTAKRLGCMDSERERAITHLEGLRWASGASMVHLALHEKDVERAWTYADRWGADGAWRELADFTPQPRPIDALELYEHAVDSALQATGRAAARNVVRLLVQMRTIASAADTDAQKRLSDFIASIRQTYKNRPTLREALDKAF